MKLGYVINVVDADAPYLARVPKIVDKLIGTKIRNYEWANNAWGEGSPEFFTAREIAAAHKWVGFRTMIDIVRNRWNTV